MGEGFPVIMQYENECNMQIMQSASLQGARGEMGKGCKL